MACGNSDEDVGDNAKNQSSSSKLEGVLKRTKMYHRSCAAYNADSEVIDTDKEGSGGTDIKFESVLLACTSDDQKEIGLRWRSAIIS